MTDFNAVRAITEEIQGLSDIQKTLIGRAGHLEKVAGEAEVELNAVKKLLGFATFELERKKEVKRRLEEQK